MLEAPDYATEFATVEKTIEFVARWGKDTLYFRIEALRYDMGSYTTHVYQRLPIVMKDAMTIENGKKIQAEVERYVWVDFPDAPWADGKTADEALDKQMSLLSDRLEHS